MTRLLKYFKHLQKKDSVDTSTLPDPDGPLNRDVPSSSIGITNTHMHQMQQKVSSERRSRGPLHYYSKIYPGIAWLCILKLYLLGVISSYLLGIQLAYSFANILPTNRTRSVCSPIFVRQLTQITPFTDVLTLQYFPKHGM